MAKVKVNYPNIPKGELVEVLHLGLFENGSTHTVSEDQLMVWRAQTGQEWPEGGTLTLDHGEAEAQRKAALVALAESDPAEAKEVKAELKEQQEFDLSGEGK